MRNWAGNLRYGSARVHRPATLEALQELIRSAPRIKALGSRHSFSDVADTTGDHVSLDGLPTVLDVDATAATVTVGGAVRYGEVGPALDRAGFALGAMASLPHISVAGACATATHGSGDTFGNLASAVHSLELVRGDGELVRLTTGEHDFPGAAVSLGALGVVTSLTLAVEPAYRMAQHVYLDLPFDRAVERFDELTTAADSVSLFTTWREPAFDQVWLKRRVRDGAGTSPTELLGARPATRQLHPVPGMAADACTTQLGEPGPWFERLPHFRMDHTPSTGDELQSEYLIPRDHAPAAITALNELRRRLAPLVQVSEVRTVAADDQWLSMSFGRPTVAIHFTWQPDALAVRALLPVVESCLAPFDPRPHWGKVFGLPPEAIRAAYPRLADFRLLASRMDPERRFGNAFLERFVYG